jgi:hypothetical protein
VERNIEILKQILNDLKYSDSYSDILISEIIRRFETSGLNEITPHLVYNALAYEEGKETARKIANYYEQILNSGTYETDLEKEFRNRYK